MSDGIDLLFIVSSSYFEKVHPIRRKVPRHLGLERFPHVRLRDAQSGKELIVLEHFHVSWDQVTCK